MKCLTFIHHRDIHINWTAVRLISKPTVCKTVMWHHALLHSYPTTINIILFMGLVDLSLGTITLVQKCMFNFCVIKHCLYKDNSRVYFTPFCTSSAGGYCRFNYTYYYWHHLFLGRSAECLHAIQSCFSKNLQCLN